MVRTFVNYFGDEAAHPIDYLEQDWCSEVRVRCTALRS